MQAYKGKLQEEWELFPHLLPYINKLLLTFLTPWHLIGNDLRKYVDQLAIIMLFLAVTVKLRMRIKDDNCNSKIMVRFWHRSKKKACSKSKINTCKPRKADRDLLDNLRARRRTVRLLHDHKSPLVKPGNKTFTSTAKGKTYSIVEQLIDAHTNQGKTLILDSGFPF